MECLKCNDRLLVDQTVHDEIENATYRRLKCGKCGSIFKSEERFYDGKIRYTNRKITNPFTLHVVWQRLVK